MQNKADTVLRNDLSMPDYSEHTSKTRSMGFNRTSMDIPVAMLPNTEEELFEHFEIQLLA